VIQADDGWYFRQSWLSDFILDPRRAQLAMQFPEEDVDGDAALCGTAVHASVEDCLTGKIAAAEMPTAARAHAARLLDETPHVSWQKFQTVGELYGHAERCATAFRDHILPTLPPGGLCEYKFRVELGEHRGIPYGITGTIDYVPPKELSTTVYDWKFPGRKYEQHEKQKAAVQPTVYCTAVIRDGLRDGWPLEFVYGLGVRRKVMPAQPHLIPVLRTEAHEEWLHHLIRSAIDMQLDMPDQPWLAIDSHFLCSETWCPWWHRCRGAMGFTNEDKFRTGDARSRLLPIAH